MPCRKVPGIFFLAAFPFLLFLMASGAAALGISDGTFSPQSGVERGKAYSQGVLLTNSPNRDNHFVVTVAGDVGSWVTSISPSDFNLTANQQQLITLAINVPANATFGSNAGTVTATATDPAAGGAVIEATRGNLHAEVIGSISCGDGVCDSGESSSNCCTDCPSASGGGGVSYGNWYCAGSGARARLVSNSSYACNSQTKAYEYVTTNTTEASQCEAGTVCSGGSCIINQTSPVCGNNVCESGESSSNCCTDCPSNAGGAGAAYGSWYCKDSTTKARTVSTTEYKCSNQTKLYEHVTTNSTETQACPSGQACSNGDCATAPATNATPVNATRSEFYWNIDWIDLNAATSAREDSLSVSPGQSISGKFAYTVWNGPVCRGGCDCIDEIVLGVEGEPKHCFYAGIPWCYPGQSGETKFSFAAPEKAGTYSLYYAASQSYTCEDAYSTYKTSTGRKPAGKVVVLQAPQPSNCGNGICDAPSTLPAKIRDVKNISVVPYYVVNLAVGSGETDSSHNLGQYHTGKWYKQSSVAAEGSMWIEKYSEEPDKMDVLILKEDGLSVNAYLPKTGSVTTSYWIASDGSSYYDRGLTQLARAAPGKEDYLTCPSDCPKSVQPSNEKCMNFYYYEGRFDYDTAKQICADVEGFDWKSRGWPQHPSGKRGDETVEGWKLRVSGQAGVLELSLATDKSSYLQGEQVRVSSKAHVSGNLVDAYVKGYAVRPDGGSDELVFARESCKQPACKPGEPCIQVACPVQTGYLNAFYNAGMEGAYYIKASASYGNSLAESSAKFFVGTQKKARLSAWLENYQYNAGDTVKVFAKLTDERGEPVLGADVSARIHWAGNVRPVYRELVGIESAAAAKRLEQTAVQATQVPKAAASTAIEGVEQTAVKAPQVAQAEAVPVNAAVPVQATQVAQAVEVAPVRTAIPATGYAIATIASSVEKQVAVQEPVAYEEEMRSREASAQIPSKEVAAYPEPMPVAKVAPEYGYVKLEYNPQSRYYEGSYSIPSDARAGTYKVAVSASAGGQHLQESTSFTLGGEDYFSFENKAKKFASDGNYKECVDNYLKAADRLSADQYRMFLDIEKAGICARLGNLPNSFYKDIGKIVEKAAGEGRERYILLGVASQYYELGGEYRLSRELLGKAASGLEDISGVLGEEQSIVAKAVIAKYYALLGEDSKAAGYYKEAAGLFAGRQPSGSEAFIANLFAARLYAKAGDIGSSREQYLLAADRLSSRSTSASDALITAFIAGDSYEKAGEPEKAREQYTRAVGLAAPGSYSAGDSFFAYSAIGKSYERLGEKEKAKEMYGKGLERLLSKQDSESYYFASGLSGYLGDYGKSKELCRKQFEQSLSEESNIGKLTFMNAYCYSVLGDGLRAKKGCDLNSITLQGDTMIMEILEPLPPPVSYCSQSTDAKRTSSCGNGAVDAGESPENCCADTGCAFGDTCSKALNKCVKPVKEIPQESILEVLLRLEDARIKLDTLEGKALAISKYYSGKDQPKSDAWAKAANVFGDAKSKIDNIKKDLKDNREKITEETLESIRQKLEDVRGSLKQAVDAILEAV